MTISALCAILLAQGNVILSPVETNKMSQTKADTLRWHTKNRLEQRYGLRYNDTVHDSLVGSIQNRDARFIEQQSCRVSVWDVTYNARETDLLCYTQLPGPMTIRCVYDKQRKPLITVLPR